MKKYIVSIAIPLAIFAAVVVFAQPVPAQAASAQDIVNLLVRLGIIPSDKVDQAGKAVSQIDNQTQTSVACYSFNRNLGIGTSGDDVTKLTSVLSSEGFLNGKSDTYDETVAAAVTGFQEKYASEILAPNGLNRGTGYVGVSTRAKLNRMCSTGIQIYPTLSPTYSPVPVNSSSQTNKPTITITYPNGGEILANGVKDGGIVQIQWTSTNLGAARVDIELADMYGGKVVKSIASSVSNTGTYTWQNDPALPSGSYRIAVSIDKDHSVQDISNNYFTVTTNPTGSTGNVSLTTINNGTSQSGTQINFVANASGAGYWTINLDCPKGITASMKGGGGCGETNGVGIQSLNLPVWIVNPGSTDATVSAVVMAYDSSGKNFIGSARTSVNVPPTNPIGAPTVNLTSPQSGSLLAIGSATAISWNTTGSGFDKYQIVVGNSITNSERQLYDRVSMVDFIPGYQKSFTWNVPDLLNDFAKGSSYSYDQIRNSFYLQIKLVKSDSAGGSYIASSNKIIFQIQ